MDDPSHETIELLCYEGFDELDVIGPFEVFSSAADRGCSIDVRLVTLAPANRVTASHGLTIEPDGAIGDILTAAGVTSGIDLSLWIVEQVCGPEIADNVEMTIEHDRSDDVHVAERE